MTPGRGLASKECGWQLISENWPIKLRFRALYDFWLGQSGESEPDNGKFPFPVLKSDRPRETIFKESYQAAHESVQGWWQVRVLIDDRGKLYCMMDRGTFFF